MRSVRTPARALAALAAAVLTVLATSTTASAAPTDPTTACVGAPSDVRVASLDVPPGSRCELDHVYVRGGARVGSRAVLSVRSSEVGGRTVVAGGALQASSATFHDLELDDAEMAYLSRATVRGSVAGAVGTLSLTGVTVTGDLDARGGTRAPETGQVLDVEGATVQGSLTSDGLEVSVDDLTVGGDALVTDAGPAPRSSLAVDVCGARVRGELRVERSTSVVSMGGARPDGSRVRCDPVSGRSAVGSLTFLDNAGSIAVAGTVVSRDLVCSGNTGPRGVQTAAVVVIGERVGQCA